MMDASAGLTASQKAIETVRALPAWLLAALLLSTGLVWLAPPLRGDLPESVVRWLPLAVTLLGVTASCRAGAEALGWLAARRVRRLANGRERLNQLYRPLAALFLTRHVTTSTGIAAPRFRHRWANAVQELGAYRRRRVGLKRAWRALFDRQSSTSAEIEYGGGFPMGDILKLVRQRATAADPTLLQLVRRADRSRHEDPATCLLTDEELALFEHIHCQHERLMRQVG